METLFSDPFSLVMLALLGLLIIFMFRNGKKRQQAMQQLQAGLVPGAEVMLQSGIYGTVVSVDEENNRVTLESGTTTLIVHRNAVSTITAAVDAPEETESSLAPDDDPAFGEHANSVIEENPVDSVKPDEKKLETPESEQAGDASAADEDPKKNS